MFCEWLCSLVQQMLMFQQDWPLFLKEKEEGGGDNTDDH